MRRRRDDNPTGPGALLAGASVRRARPNGNLPTLATTGTQGSWTVTHANQLSAGNFNLDCAALANTTTLPPARNGASASQ